MVHTELVVSCTARLLLINESWSSSLIKVGFREIGCPVVVYEYVYYVKSVLNQSTLIHSFQFVIGLAAAR